MDPLSVARYGMMSAQQTLARSAQRVVTWPENPDVDLPAEMIVQAEARTQLVVSAKVVAFDAAMWRALLSIQLR
jgi:hypothetical protein